MLTRQAPLSRNNKPLRFKLLIFITLASNAVLCLATKKSRDPIVVLPNLWTRIRVSGQKKKSDMHQQSLCGSFIGSDDPSLSFPSMRVVPSPHFQEKWKGRQDQMDLLVEKPINYCENKGSADTCFKMDCTYGFE